jgi:hypothetical protein
MNPPSATGKNAPPRPLSGAGNLLSSPLFTRP